MLIPVCSCPDLVRPFHRWGCFSVLVAWALERSARVLSGLYKEPRPRHILQSGPGSRGDRTDRRTRTSRRHWKSSTTQPTPAPPPKAPLAFCRPTPAAEGSETLEEQHDPAAPRRRRLCGRPGSVPAAQTDTEERAAQPSSQSRQTRRSEQPNPPASRHRQDPSPFL